MLAGPIRWKINSEITPIIEKSLWRKKWRSDEQVSLATGFSIDQLQIIRRNPARIPACDLYQFMKRLDDRAICEMEEAWFEISMFGNAYRRYFGWAMRAERAFISILKSKVFWAAVFMRPAIDFIRFLMRL